jgi:hypothetical protein
MSSITTLQTPQVSSFSHARQAKRYEVGLAVQRNTRAIEPHGCQIPNVLT